MIGAQAGIPELIEQIHWIGQLIAAHREYRFVDHHQGDFGVGHRPLRGIEHGQRHAGLRPGCQRRLRRLHVHIETSFGGRQLEHEIADGLCRAWWRLGGFIAGARAVADHHHRQLHIRQPLALDRNLQRVTAAFQLELALFEHAVAAEREQAVAIGEGRLHQDPCGVAWGVLIPVRDELQFLQIDVVYRWPLAATDPAQDLADVVPAGGIGGDGRDPVLAALGGVQLAMRQSLCVAAKLAVLRISQHFLILTGLVEPIHATGFDGDRAVAQGLAFEVDHDQVQTQRLATFDEIAIGLHAHVDGGRMHQRIGMRRPGLAIDVLHLAFGGDGQRSRQLVAIQHDGQIVVATGIGLSAELDAGAGARLRALAPPQVLDAEAVVALIGRVVVGDGGVDGPGYRGAGQGAARVILR